MLETQIKERQRLDYIDALKGVGILLVVIEHHLIGKEGLMIWISSFHMPLFFIITGYLYGYKKDKCEDIKHLIINKAKSLMYPYVTFSLINIIWYVVFYIIMPTNGQPEDSLKSVLLKTFTTFGYQAVWFLPALFISTILFNIINKSKFSHIIHIACLVLGCSICVLLGQNDNINTLVWCVFDYIARSVVATSFIYIGSLISRFLKISKSSTEWIYIIICAIIAGITLVINLVQMNRYYVVWANLKNPVMFYISAISNSILLLLIFKKINPKKGLLNYYGKNSLIIMALHMGFPVEVAWIIVLGVLKCPFSDTINSTIAIIIEFIIMTICIQIINKYFKFILRLPNKSKRNIENIKAYSK
ncbi:MAG: acyltransferase family protein [Acutalibacteraceae bacterium]|nr:acyltransferase family protein [Acutalibacteraceae bacterium]